MIMPGRRPNLTVQAGSSPARWFAGAGNVEAGFSRAAFVVFQGRSKAAARKGAAAIAESGDGQPFFGLKRPTVRFYNKKLINVLGWDQS
jgi:hypothetical protein